MTMTGLNIAQRRKARLLNSSYSLCPKSRSKAKEVSASSVSQDQVPGCPNARRRSKPMLSYLVATADWHGRHFSF